MQPANIKWPLAFLLCAASLWVVKIFQPGWQCLTSKQCVNIEISGSNRDLAKDKSGVFSGSGQRPSMSRYSCFLPSAGHTSKMTPITVTSHA
jgi:hypothetical protein